MTDFPRVTRHYRNHHLDSKRWDLYAPRDDDIIVTTSYKCGTTFTQQILFNMLVRNTFDDEVFPDLMAASPWIDARFSPFTAEQIHAHVEAMEGRRFLKSHLPLDGLPYFDNVRYIIVARDARDVFMSLVNHYGAYTDFIYEQFNRHEGETPMPRYDGDIRGLWKNWITRGWFDWEQEGYPFWGNMHHTQSYWDYAQLPNFLFVHYADMTGDTPGTIRRIADFIGHQMSDEEVAAVAKAVSFNRIKEQAVAASEKPPEGPQAFEGGQATFINKGTNGRWHDVLTESDIALYESTRDRVLSPDCARWLETGGWL